MRSLNYNKRYCMLLTPDIVAMLTQVHEYKGKQAFFTEIKSDTLLQLAETAKVQSTEASNRIEGISTSDDRIKKLVLDKTTPRTKNEREIIGYRDVLGTIHENYAYLPPKPAVILQLHRDLYKYNGSSIGGVYKSTDSIISEKNSQGQKYGHSRQLSAQETPEAMETLWSSMEEALCSSTMDPLLLIPLFVLDFLCIHPFNSGNHRMSRLLTQLLLCRSGYLVNKYSSIEQLIEHSEKTYYEALSQSSERWQEGENNDAPFVRYFLGVLLTAYQNFFHHIQRSASSGLSKPDRIRELIKEAPEKITKAEILRRCPDISQITVQRALMDLQNKGEILKLSGGRYAAYIWNRERE